MSDIGSDFRDLHRPGSPALMVNVWDAGSARMMAALGADALATSSAAHAFTLGRPDMGHVTRDEALSHAADIVAATNLPVSGDLENGYGDAPEDAADTVLMAAEAGLAGCGIEDLSYPSNTAYDRDHAVEKIRAAVAAARSLDRDFVLTARADGVMNGLYDMDEAIARCRAFEEVGADCVFVPIPDSAADLERLIAAVSGPVNILAAGPYSAISKADYARMGAARLSIGAALARVTHRAIATIGEAMIAGGDFSALGTGMPGDEVDLLLERGKAAER